MWLGLLVGLSLTVPSTDVLEESRAAAGQLGQQLSGELQEAMAAEGVLAAIDVCHVRAPEIRASLSTQGEVAVGRTALRVRNPDNRPNALEEGVLRQFKAQLAAGAEEPPEALVTTAEETVYMRAIPTQQACLGCHGDSLSAEVGDKIQELYPDDEATGFAAGELRGAFVIRWANENF